MLAWGIHVLFLSALFCSSNLVGIIYLLRVDYGMIYSGLSEKGVFFLQRGVLENRSYNADSQASNYNSE